jgi:hypothetical protein
MITYATTIHLFGLLVLANIAAAGQNLALVEPSPLQKQFRAVDRAMRAWNAADQNLEELIFTLPEAKARQRIQGATAAYDRYARERDTYLALWINQLSSHAHAIDSLGGEASTKGLKSTAQERVRSLARTERDLVTELRKAQEDATANGLLQREQIDRQQKAAERLQEKLQSQVEVLSSLEGSAASARETRRSMTQTIQSAIRYFEVERGLAADEARVQLKYYDQLKQMLTRAEQNSTKNKEAKEQLP